MTAASLPEGRPGKLLALALLLLAILLLWTVVAAPLVDLYQARAGRLADESMRAEHMAAIAAEAKDLRRLVAASHGPAAPRGQLFPGASDALALADLQGTVQRMAGADGVEIASIDNLPTAPAGRLRRIGLHLHASGDYPALVRLLTRMRGAEPAMLPDDLTLQARDPGSEARFDLDLALYAFRPVS